MKHVYIVRAGHNQYKIGVASNILKRIGAIQTHNGSKIDLIIYRRFDNAYAIEKELHDVLRKSKLNGGREWFELTPEQLIELLVHFNKYPALEQTTLESLYETLLESTENQKPLIRKLKLILEPYKTEPHNPSKSDVAIATKPTISDDYLDNQALEIFKEYGKASTSLVQRKLLIGYGRAARIMDRLTDRGLISETDGNKPRMLIS